MCFMSKDKQNLTIYPEFDDGEQMKKMLVGVVLKKQLEKESDNRIKDIEKLAKLDRT